MEAQRQRVIASVAHTLTTEQWKQSFLRVASDGKGISGAINAEQFVSAVRFSVTTQARSKFSTKPLPARPQPLNRQKQKAAKNGLQTPVPVVHSSMVRQLFAY